MCFYSNGYPPYDGYNERGMWNPGPQGLSVVTTVWGVTPTTQTAPFNQNTHSGAYTNTTMATSGYVPMQPNYMGGPKGSYPHPSQSMTYPRQGMGQPNFDGREG